MDTEEEDEIHDIHFYALASKQLVVVNHYIGALHFFLINHLIIYNRWLDGKLDYRNNYLWILATYPTKSY